MSLDSHTPNDNDTPNIPATLIGWGIASIALCIFMITFNNSYMVLGASFLAKAFAVIVGSILGFIGAVIGDFLRRLAMPTMTFTRGGFFSLLFIRLFWLIGPQVIGLFIGIAVGTGIVLG